MRKLIFAAFCGAILAAQPVAAGRELESPSRVTYSLGGVMSGPYSITVDLVSGKVEITTARPRGFGHSQELPVVKRFRAAEADLAQIRTLAIAVWAYGGEIIERDGGGSLKLRMCQPTMDAIGTFEIVRGSQKKAFEFSMTCKSAPASQLLDKLGCLENPDATYCRKI